MKKPTLCVIFGGKSNEYYVSLHSAYGVITHINQEKYNLVCVGITKKGQWYLFEGGCEEIANDTWQKGRVTPVTLDLSQGHLIVLDKSIYAIDVDLFFPVMHGEFVEDGRIQGLFDMAGVKYVGCDSFASHICMDKALTKDVARKMGIEVAKDVVVNAKFKTQINDATKTRDGWDFGYPVFVKPCMCGSSVGVSRAENEGELEKALELSLRYCDRVLIEEAIDGYEAEVAVMETKEGLLVSSVGMIKHKSTFYDYFAKYKSDNVEYLIPAPITNEESEYIRECAKQLFYGLGCRGLSRFDFFVKKSGGIVFNEVNTMPGFTEISMFPKLFMNMGYSYEEIVDFLIRSAL